MLHLKGPQAVSQKLEDFFPHDIAISIIFLAELDEAKLIQLGQGGMGSVLLAHDNASRQPVALKVLHPKFIHDRTVVENFLKEARIMGSINHPKIFRSAHGLYGRIVT